MTTQNWLDIAFLAMKLIAGLKAIDWVVEKWGVIMLQRSKDKVELAKANFLSVGQVTDFLLRIDTQEKALAKLSETTTLDKQQLLQLMDNQKELLHDLHENFTDFLKITASNNLKKLN